MILNVRFAMIGLGTGLAVLAGIMLYPSHSGPGGSTPRNFHGDLFRKAEFKYEGSTIQSWQEIDNNLLILDQISQKWHLLDQAGQEIETFGETGSAPWQNQEVRNFRLRGDTIYSVDTRSMAVRRQKWGAETASYRKLQEVVWDGIHLKGNEFLLLNDESESFGFFPFDIKSGLKGRLQLIGDSLDRHVMKNQNIAFEGEFVQSERYNYYICSRMGAFLVIDQQGKIISTKQTIDETSVPDIVERRAGNLVVFERQPDEIVNYSATADSKHLYILSQVAFRQGDQLKLDVYSAPGMYLKSYELPNRGDNMPMKILKGQHVLYVIYEDQYIVIYELA